MGLTNYFKGCLLAAFFYVKKKKKLKHISRKILIQAQRLNDKGWL